MVLPDLVTSPSLCLVSSLAYFDGIPRFDPTGASGSCGRIKLASVERTLI
jgi:hypothetical protein